MSDIHIYYPDTFSPEELQNATASLPVTWHSIGEKDPEFTSPAILITAGEELPAYSEGVGLCCVGRDREGELSFSIRDDRDAKGFARGLFNLLPNLVASHEKRFTKDFVDIGIQLTAEKDLDRLLELILTRARQLTISDAASLYLVREDAQGRHLVFKLAQNDSRPISLKEVTLPLSRESLAGYVAITGESLLIEDAYHLPENLPCTINRSVDNTLNYRSKSMLILPMTNHLGEIIGVIQLLNRKSSLDLQLTSPEVVEREALAYTEETKEQITALASMAAVAIENSQLYDSIRTLFEGFVQASVTAIEQRDPTTKGHSQRVSILTIELAKIVDRTDSGPFSEVKFSSEMMQEIKWAALLHDFGKVGVKENVLVKAKKLYSHEEERVEHRIRYIRKSVQADILHEKLQRLLAGGRDEFADLEEKEAKLYHQLDEYLEAILRSNLPTVLPEGDFEFLKTIQRWIYETFDGEQLYALEPEEARILSIRKGSLDEQERLEIESHVTHTYNFLKKIPWTKDLKKIPAIAYAHHEKLNGKGYPLSLSEPDIPVQSRIMTVADIFDALSASDRPYKKAVPVDRALNILKMEAEDGMLDSNLVNYFIEAEIWKQTLHLRQTGS